MTGTYVLFQMWGPFRQSLIDGHLFYVEQARKRLLTQFENIEAEADKASEDWLENNSHRFDPDRDALSAGVVLHILGQKFHRTVSISSKPRSQSLSIWGQRIMIVVPVPDLSRSGIPSDSAILAASGPSTGSTPPSPSALPHQ